MTSVQTMQNNASGGARCARMAVLLLIVTAVCGCGRGLSPPIAMSSPYERGQVWAVAPFLNESGLANVRGDRVADAMFAEVQHIRGIDAIPVNRTLLAMRELDLVAITTTGDALAVMNLLDADGIIVGTVTAFDPYYPPVIGLATELYVRDSPSRRSGIDTVQLTREPRSSDASFGALGPPGPRAVAAGVFDASNHQTLAWLNEYASHRTEPDSAFGEGIWLARMDLYTQFAAHRLLHEILAAEWQRVHQLNRQTE